MELQGVSGHPGRKAYPGQDRITWSGYNPPVRICLYINCKNYLEDKIDKNRDVITLILGGPTKYYSYDEVERGINN